MQKQHPKATVFLLSVISLSTANAGDVDLDTTFYITTMDFPPYVHCDGKEVKPSFILEVFNTICDHAQLSCLLECFPNRRAKAMFKAGHAHGNYPLAWNPEREGHFIWSPKINSSGYAYYRNQLSTINNESDLTGKTVGVFGPSNVSRYLYALQKDLMDSGESSFFISMEPLSKGNNFSKLSANRIDAVYSNIDIANVLIKERNISNIDIAFNDKKINYYFGFLKKNYTGNNKKLIDRFNQSASYLKSNKVLSKLVKKYGMTDSVDGIK